mmetsp:Transcript_41439/g.67343  ORF Transcript_41439/g.67343 Transcript_41439/m.67343 type:complete len:381 (-) Transcript_41439:127-1269(-)
MAVRCMLSQQPTTQLCCLPIQVPTKWYPLILALIFQLMGIDFGMISCLCAGYMYAYFPERLQASRDKLRGYEQGRFAFLARKEGFVALDAAGAAQVFNPYTVGGDRQDAGQQGGGGGFLSRMMGGGQPQQGGNGGSGGGGMFSSSPPSSSHTFTGAGYRLGTREEGEASRAPSAAAGRGGSSDVEMTVSMGGRQTASSNTGTSANNNSDKLQRQRNVLAERLERRLQHQQRHKPQSSSPSRDKDQKFQTTQSSILVEEDEIGERDGGPSVFSIDDDCDDADDDIDGVVAVAITSGSEGKLPDLLPYPHSASDENKTTTSDGDHNSNEKWMQDFANQHDIDIEALVRRNGCSRQAALQMLVACNGDFQKAEALLISGGGNQ